MFNFTTTNVINSNKDQASKKDLWSVESYKENGEDKKSFNVLRIGNFKAGNVEVVYKAKAFEAKMEALVIPFDGIDMTKGDQLRIELYIGLTQASQDSRYSNDLIYKGKPFSVEFIAKDDKAETLKNLKKIIDKYQLLVYGDKQLDAEVDGTNLVIIAKTEYQRFKKAEVSKYAPDANQYPYSGQYDVLWTLEDNKDEAATATVDGVTYSKVLTPGLESFGTFDYIMHNLRLPTCARTHAFAIDQEEYPVVGALYDQYTIHYCVNRGPLGLNAVGDQVTSKTTHVFYVNQALAEDFEKKMLEAFEGVTFKEMTRAYDSADGKVVAGEPKLKNEDIADGVLFEGKKA